VRVRYELSKVAVRGGDYVPGELEKVVNLTAKNMAACNEMKALGTDRKSWLVFTISVDHAFHICESLKMLGIRAAVLTGETPARQRAQLIEDFKTHKIRALVNVNCLTTGFNARGVDLIAFMRPTKSPGLYSQMAGRGMRLSPETGKTDCLVLDFAGLIETHGPITQIKPPPNKDDPDGDAPEKECPACYMLVNLSARQCPYCQHVFEKEPETGGTSISPTASTIDIMGRDQATAQHRKVDRMNCYVHKKEGQPASLRVTYYAPNGDQIATEWVCLFHRGYAKKKAMQWWADHLPGDKQNPAPIGIDEAVQRAKQWGIRPLYLNVEPDGRYIKINYRVMPLESRQGNLCG
jgi:DNA repair protein RadD